MSSSDNLGAAEIPTVQVGTLVAPEDLWLLAQHLEEASRHTELALRAGIELASLGMAAGVGAGASAAHTFSTLREVNSRTEQLAAHLVVAIERYTALETEVTTRASGGAEHLFELLQPLLAPMTLAVDAVSAQVRPAAERLVSVQQTERAAVRAPAGLVDVLDRIPRGDERIRIERYVEPGAPGRSRWLVYIAGTDSAGMVSGTEPFDINSNLQLVTPEHEQHAASLQAVRAALVEAGHTAGESTVLIGHSQGGLIANELASDPNLAVQQVVTFGTPLGSAVGETPTLAFANMNDVVPALAGVALSAATRVVVRTRAIGATGIVGPHELSAYRAAAARMQSSQQRDVRESVTRVTEFGKGQGTATLWHANRGP